MMTSKQAPEREEIESLLPWHAAGTLSRSDSERVERALASDQELARRFALVREELSETIHLNETLGAPSSRAMERLFAKIDAEPVRQRSVSFASASIASRIADFITGLSPRTLAFSAGAAAFALLLQAGVITTVLVGGGNSYDTASAPATSAAAGPQVLIRFAPTATAADITRLLESNQATLVSGPQAGGMYRIAVTGLPKAELANVVKRLQDDKSVGFAAPAAQ